MESVANESNEPKNDFAERCQQDRKVTYNHIHSNPDSFIQTIFFKVEIFSYFQIIGFDTSFYSFFFM